MAIVMLVLLFVGLGIGIGLGLRRKDHGAARYPVFFLFSVHRLHLEFVSNNNNAMSCSSQTASKLDSSRQSILTGSSLAAISLPNGDRNVFFQELSGRIRFAAYSSGR